MATPHNGLLNWQALSRHGLKRRKLFQSILFPINFSAACKQTAPYVRSLADLTGGTVTLLHVVPGHSGWYGAADIHEDATSYQRLCGMKRTQLCALAAFQHEYFENVPCETRVAFGCIGEQIVDYAEHAGMDLIMMSTAAAAEAPRRFVSPTLTHVLRESSCPVWSAPQSDRLRSFEGLNSIVCALPREGISGRYVNEAVAIADVFEGKLTFVSAASPGIARTEESRVLSLEEEFPEAGLDQLATGGQLPVFRRDWPGRTRRSSYRRTSQRGFGAHLPPPQILLQQGARRAHARDRYGSAMPRTGSTVESRNGFA
jgi:nucleotide-binding universal stress UspA family protein